MWKILFVDEDRQLSETLRRACAGFGEVLPVSGAAEAERLLRAVRVHLVVLEYRLRDGSGLDLVAGLKARWPRLPIIMSAADGSEAICCSAFKLGVRDYFIKPWAVQAVRASIQAILSVSERSLDARRNVIGPPSHHSPQDQPSAEPDEALIRRALRLIDERCSEPPGLGELAQQFGLSVFTLSRKFKRITRVTFRRYVIDARIARARELLRVSSHTVTEIAQLVGFSDLPRFDKVFKGRVGVSPSSYRATNNNLAARNY